MNPHLPPRSRFSFGTVVVNHDKSLLLLREPKNHHDGFVWTFAKGTPEPKDPERLKTLARETGNPYVGERPMESPQDTALRESREEYGWDLEILRPIPHWFAGPQWANYFFLACAVTPLSDGPCWETESVRWFSWDEAEQAIAKTLIPHRRQRDFEILAAARKVAARDQLPPQSIEWSPGNIRTRIGEGVMGANIEMDLNDFWKGLYLAARARESGSTFIEKLKESGQKCGDPLLLQAFFLSTAVLLRQISHRGLPSPDTESEFPEGPPWWDLIARGGIRRAFYSIYGGPLTGIPGVAWDAANWCRMVANWVPEFILGADQEALAAWCESFSAGLDFRNED
jgi:8-oxo-dGTP pyrophosphatase MutT (NUDIX family)